MLTYPVKLDVYTLVSAYIYIHTLNMQAAKASHIIGPVKQKHLRKIVIIFLSISLSICFGCSKEPSHQDGSFEYQQHMF